MIRGAFSTPLHLALAGATGAAVGFGILGAFQLSPSGRSLTILALLFPFVAMIVGNLRRLLLTIVVFDISLQLDVNLFHRPEAEALGALSGLTLSATTLCLAALYALWLGELLARRTTGRIRVGLAPALYVAFVALSLVVARDPTLAGFEVFMLVQMLLLFVYVASTVRTRGDALFLITVLLIALTLQSVIMIGTAATRQEFSVAGITNRVGASYTSSGTPRPGGTMRSPINAASFLGLLLAPALSILMTTAATRLKLLAVLAFGLGGIAMILTQSRGGWITVALSVVLLVVFVSRRSGSVRPVLAVAALMILLLLPFRTTIPERVLGDDGDSASARLPLALLALDIIAEQPLLGVGANNFSLVMEDYITSQFGRAWRFTVHNKFLLVWAETGIFALLAFIAFLVVTVWRGWRCWLAGDPLLSPLALAFAAAILAQLIHMNVDTFHSRPQVQMLWFAAGLIAAIHAMLANRTDRVG